MTSSGTDDLRVVDEPSRQRYEARLGDRVVGYTEYRAVRGRLILFHTEVDPAAEGQGIGSRLASGALDDIRSRGLKVTVKCPFIAAYLKRHPEYQDLRVELEVAGNRQSGQNVGSG
jgi:predicted GNAT family acetyltransferase